MVNVISIVTPSFNQGKYLGKTIESVIKQKGDFYIDYIIQDGGSKDESVDVIRTFEKELEKKCDRKKLLGLNFFVNKKKSPRFLSCLGVSYRWISKPDKGQTDGIMKGYRLAKGDILNWLNSDDVFMGRNVFSKVFSYFLKEPKLKIVTADGYQIDKEDNKIGIIRVTDINIPENIFLDYHILQPSTFTKKDIYDEKFFDLKYKVAFDVDYYLNYFTRGYKYLKTRDRFSGYRFYPEIKTLSLGPKRFWEQTRLSFKYSKNIFAILLGFIYHYLEIIYIRKHENGFIAQVFFPRFRKACYKILVGKTDRV